MDKKQLFSLLRQQKVKDLGQVKYAYLEINGEVSVFKYPKNKQKKKETIIFASEYDKKPGKTNQS